MCPTVRYGSDRSFQLDAPLNGRLTEFGRPLEEPLADCALGVRAALAAPLGYPPLADIATADDRIVLAVDSALPSVAEIVAEVLRTLTAAGVSPGGITVLYSAQSHADEICRLVPADIRREIHPLRHVPSDPDSMAYLATTQAGEPVVFNRILTDADLVLPIGCVRDSRAGDYYGINGSLFPAFSDENTQRRFRSAGGDETPKKQLCKEADEAAWLLGISFTIQVIPGAGQQVLHVVAGNTAEVGARAAKLFSAAWHQRVPAPAKLVVATMEGPREQQTWHNLGRAVANAAALVEEDGAVAVFSELAEKPGPGVHCLAQARSPSQALLEIAENLPADALPAAQLAEALDRIHIYLKSNLDDAFVEDLEITPIASPAELNRLIDGMVQDDETCILLSNAPHANVTLTFDTCR